MTLYKYVLLLGWENARLPGGRVLAVAKIGSLGMNFAAKSIMACLSTTAWQLSKYM